MKVTAILLILVILGGVFCGGMAFQYSKQIELYEERLEFVCKENEWLRQMNVDIHRDIYGFVLR